jgi:hypothetical protein
MLHFLNADLPTRVSFFRVTAPLLLTLLTWGPLHAQVTTQPTTPNTTQATSKDLLESFTIDDAKAIRARLAPLLAKYPAPPASAQLQVKLVTSDGKPLPSDASPVIYNFRAREGAAVPVPLTRNSPDTWTAAVEPGFFTAAACVPGYAASTVSDAWVKPGQSSVTLQLTPVPPRTLRFVDAAGDPVKVHYIHVLANMESKRLVSVPTPNWGYRSRPIKPDLNSAFRIAMDDRLDLFVEPYIPGFKIKSYDLQKFAPLNPNDDIVIQLQPSQSISARVVDAATGKPIPGAVVRPANVGLALDLEPGAITNADGLFTYDTLRETFSDGSRDYFRPFLIIAPGYGVESFTPTQIGHDENAIQLKPEKPLPITVTGDLSRLQGFPDSPRLIVSGSFGYFQIPLTIEANTARGTLLLNPAHNVSISPDWRSNGPRLVAGQPRPETLALQLLTPAESRDIRLAATNPLKENVGAAPFPIHPPLTDVPRRLERGQLPFEVGALFGKVVDHNGTPIPDYVVTLAQDNQMFMRTRQLTFGSAQGFCFPAAGLNELHTVLVDLPGKPGKSARVALVRLTPFSPARELTIVLPSEPQAVPPQPSANGSPDLALKSNYTFQIALFNTPSAADNLQRAQETARQIQNKDHAPHVFQDPYTGQAIVTLGAFGAQDFRNKPIMTPEQALARQIGDLPAAQALRQQFPTQSINGAPADAQSPKTVLITVPTFELTNPAAK